MQHGLCTRLLTLTLAIAIAGGHLTAQQPAAAAAEEAAFRQMAASIPLGTRVKVRVASGRRLTGTLLAATDEGVIVKRESRIPEPSLSIPYGELVQLQRDAKSGFSVGKAIGIGLAAGAGAILTLFGIAVAVSD